MAKKSTTSKKSTTRKKPAARLPKASGAKKLKVAGIGIGGIWRSVHGPAWLEHDQAELVGVCDIQPDKAKRYAQEHGIANACKDYRDILKRKEIDAVDICTSNKFHSEIAVAALEAGKHVFCEKPDAINPAEARRMADAAKASGKTLMVMRNNRFRADAQFVKQYADSGKMGQIYAGRCGWVRRRGIPGKGGWFTTKELSGGGPLIDLGVHMIDLAIWLMGNPRPVSVSGATFCKFAEQEGPSDSEHAAFGEAKAGGIFDVEDLAMGLIRFENGAVLQIEFSWASNIEHEHHFVELRGEKAGTTLGRGEPLKLYTESDNGVICDLVPQLPKPKWGGHRANIYHFIDVVMGRAEPINTPEDGCHMIGVLSAMYESARTGREVRL
jgi:predicted dehydrogenase